MCAAPTGARPPRSRRAPPPRAADHAQEIEDVRSRSRPCCQSSAAVTARRAKAQLSRLAPGPPGGAALRRRAQGDPAHGGAARTAWPSGGRAAPRCSIRPGRASPSWSSTACTWRARSRTPPAAAGGAVRTGLRPGALRRAGLRGTEPDALPRVLRQPGQVRRLPGTDVAPTSCRPARGPRRAATEQDLRRTPLGSWSATWPTTHRAGQRGRADLQDAAGQAGGGRPQDWANGPGKTCTPPCVKCAGCSPRPRRSSRSWRKRRRRPSTRVPGCLKEPRRHDNLLAIQRLRSDAQGSPNHRIHRLSVVAPIPDSFNPCSAPARRRRSSSLPRPDPPVTLLLALWLIFGRGPAAAPSTAPNSSSARTPGKRPCTSSTSCRLGQALHRLAWQTPQRRGRVPPRLPAVNFSIRNSMRRVWSILLKSAESAEPRRGRGAFLRDRDHAGRGRRRRSRPRLGPDTEAVHGILARTLMLQSPCPEASFWQALCHVREGRADLALSTLARSLGRRRQGTEQQQASPKRFIDPPLYYGALLLRGGQPKEALRYFGEANRVDSNCPFVTAQLGTAMIQGGGDVQIAVRASAAHPDRATQLRPLAAKSAAGLCRGLSGVGLVRAPAGLAVPLCLSPVGRRPATAPAQANAALGQGLYRLGNYQEAAEVFNKLLQESAPSRGGPAQPGPGPDPAGALRPGFQAPPRRPRPGPGGPFDGRLSGPVRRPRQADQAGRQGQ